ncbi:MAG: hypothetical protein WAV73_05715 [Candidatus Moraniibacteriota bacterium]
MNHAFLDLVDVQKASKTLYCGGFDIHPQKDLAQNTWAANMAIYGFRNGGQIAAGTESYGFYERVVSLEGLIGAERSKYAGLLAAIEDYLFYVLELSVLKCNLGVFKPQFGLYIQFGPAGMFLLQRLRRKIETLSEDVGRRLIAIIDAKPGDVSLTQGGYFLGYLGNLLKSWGINHSPFNFDVTNPSPWMGEDAMCLEDVGKDGTKKSMIGLNLLREGKGLVYVNKTSNPSGKQYQDLLVKTEGNVEMALYLKNAMDARDLSEKHGLEEGGVSHLGLVVGATNFCDGSIRKMFPTHTSVNPGFGAQSKEKLAKDPLIPYKKVILELRRDDDKKLNGTGGIWSSSRNNLFPWKTEYGGSGDVNNLEADLDRAIGEHRALEEEAFNLPQVIDAGIRYPF